MNRCRLASVAGLAAVAGAALAFNPGMTVMAQNQPAQNQPGTQPNHQHPGTARPGQPGDRPAQPAQPAQPRREAQPGTGRDTERRDTQPGTGRDTARPGARDPTQPGGTQTRNPQQILDQIVKMEIQLDMINRNLEAQLSEARNLEGEQKIDRLVAIIEGILEEHTVMNHTMQMHRQMMASQMGAAHSDRSTIDRPGDLNRPTDLRPRTPGVNEPMDRDRDRVKPGADRDKPDTTQPKSTPDRPDDTTPRRDPGPR